MTSLSQSQKDVVIFIERKFQSQGPAWNVNRRRETLFRILDFYQLIGIDRAVGLQLEQATTSDAMNVAPSQMVAPATQAAINRRIFGENV